MAKMEMQIDSVNVRFVESTRAAKKPCVKCGKPTRGRLTTNGGKPEAAHLECAISQTIGGALGAIKAALHG